MNLYRPADEQGLLDRIRNRHIAVIGYGSQGRAQTLNLLGSGCRVIVGLPHTSTTRATAQADGVLAMDVADAARHAEIVMMLTPDERMPEIYAREIEPHLRADAALGFAHGFAYHFRKLIPRSDLAVFLVAPKGPGVLVRQRYEQGGGVICLVGAGQDPRGDALSLARAYACAIGGGRIGLMDVTFRDEAETDLFGEQAVLCGGASELIRAGFETLVDAGYPPEMAYFECCHELKQVVDLIYEHGIAGMRGEISNTAEYGDLTRGQRIIGPDVRRAMREILDEVRSGRFADEWMAEHAAGLANMRRLGERDAGHPIEQVGARLRAAMRGENPVDQPSPSNP